jgi:nucleotide-binding universal stress UspA family protein
MSTEDRVLVATDLLEGSDAALCEGARLSAASGAPLGVVHVVPPLEPVRMLFPQEHAADAIDVGAQLGRAEEAVAEQIARVLGAPPVEIFVDQGLPYDAIVARASLFRATVLVVGSHGGGDRVFAGVAGRVVRHARCKVLVVRGHEHRGGVLAATDLSTLSLPAIVAGDAEARRRDGRLTVVHAVGFLSREASYLLAPTGGLSAPESEIAIFARALEGEVVRRGIRATCEILDGPPASAIVREAAAIDADLIVVAGGGNTGLGRVTRSVAEKVARRAPCSVLVVREPPA